MTSSSLSSSSVLAFEVRRREPELLKPAKPTPHEFKYLSDIDDQDSLRCVLPGIILYQNETAMRGKDPVKVIRLALADALVFYYPLAGRIREVDGRKLVVECTGEGILFIEADADVRLEEFSDTFLPPFPCLDELIYDFPGPGDVLGCPLLLIQVTRLICGGFILTYRFNHTMCDGVGLFQFMSAMAEMARGAQAPPITPVWERELLNARDPHPSGVTFSHREYDQEVPDPHNKGTLISLDHDIVQRSFFFGPSEMAALWKHVPAHLRKCTKFDLLTACIWRCRTIAIQPNPEEEMRMLIYVNARSRFQWPPLPIGFYGNVLASPAAVSTASKLCQNPIGYALELLMKAKAEVTEEYMRSMVNLIVMKGRPHISHVASTYMVSDHTRLGFRNLDFGWGKPVYAGIAKADLEPYPWVCTFYIPFRNNKGEDVIIVPVCLPRPAMDKFMIEIESMINEPPTDLDQGISTSEPFLVEGIAFSEIIKVHLAR